MAEQPQYIDINPKAIKDSIKADYEQMTGRVLHPGQVEQLLINAFAYREYLLRIQINEAANQNLVEFSRAPFLDYLGQLVGVRRLTSSAAVCPVKMTLVPGHGALLIPAGIRIQSTDGQAVFVTDSSVSVASNIDEVTVNAVSIREGKDANGYAAGDIVIILDPQPYLFSAENTDETKGGADAEADDELRERIKLAPQSFSNAGSKGAYEYFARTANPAIVDVAVTSPIPGDVNIYPLLEDGGIPNQTILDEVAAVCNADKVRPLTDTVNVLAPTPVHFDIEVDLTLITGAVASDVKDLVESKLEEYADNRKRGLGLDVVLEAIIRKSMQNQVYSVAVTQPASTQVINPEEVAICDSITVNVVGYSDE